MVTRQNAPFSRRALTLVEVVVTTVLMGVVFTGVMGTMTITMKRISSSAQTENDEKQMDRAQMEIGYFVARSADIKILDQTGAEAEEGDILVCELQTDGLEKLPTETATFSLSAPDASNRRSLSITIASTTAQPKTYTYTRDLRTPVSTPMFSRKSTGFVKYAWELDSGYGKESFNNMAIPNASL